MHNRARHSQAVTADLAEKTAQSKRPQDGVLVGRSPDHVTAHLRGSDSHCLLHPMIRFLGHAPLPLLCAGENHLHGLHTRLRSYPNLKLPRWGSGRRRRRRLRAILALCGGGRTSSCASPSSTSALAIGKPAHGSTQILAMFPCVQPADGAAFRIALAKYLEALRNAVVHRGHAASGDHASSKGDACGAELLQEHLEAAVRHGGE